MWSYKLLGLVGFRVYLYCVPADRHFDKSAFDVRIACLARPQADERDPGADGPHECAEGLTAGAPTSMTCLTPTYA